MFNVLLGFIPLSFLLFSLTAYADDNNEPWFAGTLLSQPAEVVPLGHVNLQLFDFSMRSNYIYDQHRQLVRVEENSNTQVLPNIIYGLTKNIDATIQPTYIQNKTESRSTSDIGDTSVILGLQVLSQENHKWRPDLRVALEEILPSGRYDHLLEANHGTDASGMGSYQTNISFNFQHLLHVQGEHYLNGHLSFGYLYASTVHINGISTYGGNPLTRGEVKPGSLFTLDLAEEFNFTQHWAILVEGYFQYQQADHFTGDYGKISKHLEPKTIDEIKNNIARLFPTKHNIGSLFLNKQRIGNGTLNLLSLAPALEYNFSKDFGIMAGGWFSFYGKNTADFVSLAIGLNAFF